MKHLLLFLFTLSSVQTFAQTQADYERNYWNYRDRFKKFYIKIGTNSGESLPLGTYIPSSGLGCYTWEGAQGPDMCGEGWGAMNFGADVLATHMSTYLPTLAMEYHLLKEANQNYMPTLNELYYALNALIRLDVNGDRYYNTTNFPAVSNGFFIRDDVNHNFGQGTTYDISTNWSNQHEMTMDQRDKVKIVHSVAHPLYECNSGFSFPAFTENEMSQDQALGALFGLSFVIKFCADAPTVQPDGSLPAVQPAQLAKEIFHTMAGYIAATKPYDRTVWLMPWIEIFGINIPVINIPIPHNVTEYGNYIITNPVHQDRVDPGWNSRFFAYPLNNAHEDWYGGSLSDGITSIRYIPFTPGYQMAITVPLSTQQEFNTVGQFMYENDWDNDWQVDALAAAGGGLSFFLNQVFSDDEINVPANPEWINSWTRGLMLDMATISGAWSHEWVAEICKEDKQNAIMYDLAYSVLHNETPLLDRSLFDSKMNAAPCEGPQSGSSVWRNTNIWSHPDDGVCGSYYNGSDYCFLYNLYRIAFDTEIANEPGYSSYSDEACPCTNNSVLATAEWSATCTDPGCTHSVNQEQTIYRRFPSYLDFQSTSTAYDGGIHINEYLTKDLTIGANENPVGNNYNPFINHLNVLTDLYVCYNAQADNPGVSITTLTLAKWGNLFVGDEIENTPSSLTIRGDNVFNISTATATSDEAAALTVFPNSKVEIQEGATLNLYPYGKIIIKDNASLRINWGAYFNVYPNTEIILEGENSVLTIDGYWNLADNTDFTFTGDGYIQRYSSGQSSFTCGDNCTMTLNGSDKNDLVLRTFGSWFSVPDNLTYFTLTNCNVQCDNGTAVSVGVACTIDKVKINRSPSATGTYVHKGLNIYDQNDGNVSTALVNNVEVSDGWQGVFVNAYSITHTLSNLNIYNCEYSLLTVNGGVILVDCILHDNVYGWESNGATHPCTASGLISRDNEAYGVSYYGSAPAPLMMDNCSIFSNGGNGIEISDARAYLHCCNIFQNEEDGIQAVAGAALILNPSHGDLYGECLIHNNFSSGIRLKWARDLNIRGGRNRFNGNTSPLNINGTFMNEAFCSNYILPGDNNQWGANSSTQPVFNVNYYTRTACSVGQTMVYQDVNITDPAPVYAPGCEGVLSDDGDFGPGMCEYCGNVTLNGVTKPLHHWVNEAEQLMGTTSNKQNKLAFDNLYGVLTVTNPSWNETESHFIKKAYYLSSNAYGLSLFRGELRVPTAASFANNTIDAVSYNRFNQLNEQKLTDPVCAGDSISKLFDQVITASASYSLAGQYDSAQAVLSSLDEIGLATFQKTQMHWTCVTNALQMLREEIISKEELVDAIHSCTASYRFEESDDELQTVNVSGNTNLAVTATPNPAANQTTLFMRHLSDGSLMVQVFDQLGKKWFAEVRNVKGDLQSQKIDLSGWPQGIYLVEVINNNQRQTIKLNISNPQK